MPRFSSRERSELPYPHSALFEILLFMNCPPGAGEKLLYLLPVFAAHRSTSPQIESASPRRVIHKSPAWSA